MSIYRVPDTCALNLREVPVVCGVDFSADEEALALSDQLLAAHAAAVERVNRLNSWADEQSIDRLLLRRIEAAKVASNTRVGHLMAEKFENMLEGKDAMDGLPSFDEFLASEDPISVAAQMVEVGVKAAELAEKLETSAAYCKAILPAAEQQAQTAIRAAVMMQILTLTAYDLMMLRVAERVEHGVPEWDAEQRCEKELDDPSVPTMNGYTSPSAIQRDVERQAEDGVALRLLSGLFGDDQNWV